jgi:hypothetical protein
VQQVEINFMDEFILLVRSSYPSHQPPGPQRPPLQLWQEWVDYLRANGTLVALRPYFDEDGRVLTPGQPTADGPYVEGEAAISGVLFIRAADYEAATRIAQGCPVLALGGTVEVRLAQ